MESIFIKILTAEFLIALLFSAGALAIVVFYRREPILEFWPVIALFAVSCIGTIGLIQYWWGTVS